MNYGAFHSHYDENNIEETNIRIKDEQQITENRLKMFIESLFGSFRKDKRYLYGLIVSLIFITTLPFNISLLSKNNKAHNELTLVETMNPPSINNNNINNINQNIGRQDN
jgi:hypothetical protein